MIPAHLAFIGTLMLYVASAVLFLVSLIVSIREKAQRLNRVGVWFFCLAFGVHTLAVLPFFWIEGWEALNDRADFSFWLAWALAFMQVAMRRYFRFPVLNAGVNCAVVLFMASSSILAHQAGTPEIWKGGAAVLIFHALPILLAELSLALACVVSIVFLFQERRLKHLAVYTLERDAPSLQGLELFNRRLIQFGFLAMGLAILSGAAMAVGAQRSLFIGDLYQWGALAVWLSLAIILQLRMHAQWSARRVSLATVLVATLFFAVLFVLAVYLGKFPHAQYHS